MVKNDKRYGLNIFKDESLKSAARVWYLKFKWNKSTWTYEKALGFKNWNKVN